MRKVKLKGHSVNSYLVETYVRTDGRTDEAIAIPPVLTRSVITLPPKQHKAFRDAFMAAYYQRKYGNTHFELTYVAF